MSSARFGRVVQRWWLFIAAVTGATLAAAIVWQLVGPVGLRAEAELLLQLNLPEDSQSLQFGVESSRALASGVVIEDLARLTRVGRPMDANPGGDGVPLVEFEVVIEMFEGVILEVARGIAEVVEFGQLLDGAGAPSAKTGAELGQRRL